MDKVDERFTITDVDDYETLTNKIFYDEKHMYNPKEFVDYQGFNYIGPFFLQGRHGIGAHGAGENSDNGVEESLIFKTCIYQIKHSDIFLAWITSSDQYGTLVELGYANQLGLKCYIAFDNALKSDMSDHDAHDSKFIYNDMWFVRHFAKDLGYLNSFDEAINKIQEDMKYVN
jgi:nucleoside 2-deoxyribosyltransferase